MSQPAPSDERGAAPTLPGSGVLGFGWGAMFGIATVALAACLLLTQRIVEVRAPEARGTPTPARVGPGAGEHASTNEAASLLRWELGIAAGAMAGMAGLGLWGRCAGVRQRRLLGELAQARQEADRANAVKTEFLSSVSHEIRTPLASIMGHADLLISDGDLSRAPRRRTETLSTIRTAGEHLLSVVNDILDISKLEAGRLDVVPVEADLRELVDSVSSILRPAAAQRSISLDVEYHTPLPDRVVLDPNRLRQILLNLAGNAVKFTQSGGVRLHVSILESGSTDRLRVDVADSGPGLSPEQVDRLFRPFGQGDMTVSSKFGGTGLGLVISRRLAVLMGGSVELVESRPGVGSRFRVEVPFAVAHVRDVEPPDLGVEPVVLRGRILVAEDGVDNQRLIRYWLEKAGAEVQIAQDGLAAHDELRRVDAAGRAYDLLLTDIHMPGLDGLALVRRLREERDTTPIIALSASATTDDRRRCLEAGADDYASKPLNPTALVSLCARWMTQESRRLRRPAA